MQDGIPQGDDRVAGSSSDEGQAGLDGQRLARRPQDPFAEAYEWNDEQDLSRCHRGLHDLNGGKVQSKRQRERSA